MSNPANDEWWAGYMGFGIHDDGRLRLKQTRYSEPWPAPRAMREQFAAVPNMTNPEGTGSLRALLDSAEYDGSLHLKHSRYSEPWLPPRRAVHGDICYGNSNHFEVGRGYQRCTLCGYVRL